jgi:signal transduction histidine kinase
MVRAVGPFVRPRSGRRLLALFALTILLPALLLAALGVRAIRQERRLAEQQAREALERAADLALLDVEREVRSWRSTLERFASTRTVSGDLPPTLRVAFSEPGVGLVLSSGAPRPFAWPERQFLYRSPELVSPVGLETSFSVAESAELRDGNPVRALELYRTAFARARSTQLRAAALQRVARTLRKLHRDGEALEAYRQLSAIDEWIGAVPAELIARYETSAILASQNSSAGASAAALHLYKDLVDGRWPLEKTRYLYYSTAVRGLITGDPADADARRLSRIEERKTRLTEAGMDWLENGALPAAAAQRYVLIETEGQPRSAMLLSTEWLAAHMWPRTLASTVARGVDLSLTGPHGQRVFTTAPSRIDDVQRSGISAVRMLNSLQTSWHLTVTPRDPATFVSDVSRRQTMYLVMLGLVVALLASGSYLTFRVVKREVEIARLQSDFVSTVSHEFRSPLTGIRQLAEMLARGRVPSEGRRQEYYDHIVRESDRLTRLVENVLDFSRMEDGRRQYRMERLETTRWLRGVIDEARSAVSEIGPRIEAAIPEPLPSIDADPTALACAVHNLIDNAVKYSPGREAVWVDADARDGRIAIRVHDRGVGITEQDRRYIFDRFYRARADITREVKGAGLGLSLVARIVQAHGGVVTCESRPGEGSTFAIHLNASDAAGEG